MFKLKHLALSAALALGACGTIGGLSLPAPKTPSQTFIELNAGYDSGLSIAAQYRKLPTCGTTAAALCSSPAILAQINAAVSKASPLVDAAQTASQTAGSGSSALADAQAAVDLLTSLTAPIAAQLAAAHAH